MDIADLKAELERLHPSSFGWAMSCCRRDQTEAEEVLQTVYLKIIEGKARFRGEASFKTWLFAVIRKTAISEHRRNLVRRLRDVVVPSSPQARSAGLDTPDAVLEKSEAQLRFQTALLTLPVRQRETLHLVFYEDLSLREAACVMGISVGSARQHYDRGKRRLRQTIEQMEPAYGINWRRKENPRTV
jgi:RNA polymerase sigma factor (sigma-70 family)